LPNGLEILLALGHAERIPVRKRAALPNGCNVVIGNLSLLEVTRTECFAQLLDIAIPGLEIRLKLLVQRSTRNG
jgi:hypothetical protein